MEIRSFSSIQACLCICLSTFCIHGTYIRPASYKMKGDIILGGLFPLHYKSDRADNYR